MVSAGVELCSNGVTEIRWAVAEDANTMADKKVVERMLTR